MEDLTQLESSPKVKNKFHFNLRSQDLECFKSKEEKSKSYSKT